MEEAMCEREVPCMARPGARPVPSLVERRNPRRHAPSGGADRIAGYPLGYGRSTTGPGSLSGARLAKRATFLGVTQRSNRVQTRAL